MAERSKKDQIRKRVEAMRQERTSFVQHWRELSEYTQPRRGRFLITDRNKGDKRHHKIINSVGSEALRICTSGMFAGTMSPARPWFALETDDPQLMEYAPVKNWCYDVEGLIRRVLASSNFYNQAPVMLSEMILFGTGCMLHVDDFEDVARFYTQTAGSYMIAQNNRMDIDTLAREFEWTVEQVVAEFGYDQVSKGIQNQYDNGNYDAWVPIVHFIGPNRNYDKSQIESKYKKYKSCYYERDGTGKDFLRESGFDEFPAYCPRWGVANEDIYGTDCPGMIALGDVKSIQHQEKRKAQAIDKMVNPPLKGPPSLRNVPVSSLPGSLNIYDADANREGLTPLYQVTPQIGELRQDMEAIERRVKDAYFVNLFMAISEMEGIQPRNQLDLTERNQERLLQLGPVLERLQGEFQNKLIDRVFNQLVEAQVIGGARGLPIPSELSGKPLKVNYISTLAMAQRQTATTGIERVAGFTANLVAGGWAQAGDKFDADQAIDEYAKAIGVPPRVIIADEQVAQVRDARAQMQQQQQAMMAAQAAADTAKTVGDTDTSGQNALTDIINAASR